jgi:hypothetical protein
MKTEAIDRSDPAYAGQAPYTALKLHGYDLSVYWGTGPLAWRCSKGKFLGLYDQQVSGRHLDIGVASGTLLNQCRFPVPKPDLTLMDLSPGSLSFAARRLRRYSPHTHQANVLKPWGLPPARFESVAMMNVLHCVPGTIREKAVAFDHAGEVLVPGGVFFGATVLGKGVRHTRRSRWVMRKLNEKGAFTNLDDSLDDLDEALGNSFSWHEVDVQGTIALFVARTAS